jgi:hypothetical protein
VLVEAVEVVEAEEVVEEVEAVANTPSPRTTSPPTSSLHPRCMMLRTRLTPLAPQDNEDLVRLVVDADTGNLHLVDMLLELELLLTLAIDRWTDCVAQKPYTFGSGMVSPSDCD